uniref:NADH-ubiquinone oxidoreductase chain 6 n=1 Tax=Remiarctus bertholdii TaxID=1104393 RepID=A0A411ATT1_9EUCA|nr:NADH dehydrogenase subunit 6 [Remiarctus bertholdii]QAX91422.1 NADH dehydrogenase subunit 6 [Remiarctus bertholdii]
MLLITLPLTLFIAALFTQLTHPLSMGLMLLLQTILICSCSGIMLPSFWFSYILFLIFLGAMLVLFIYVTSLASNEPLTFSMSYSFFFILLIPLITLILILSDPLITFAGQSNMMSIYLFNSLNLTNLLTSSIYNQSTMMFTIFIVLYLLLTLFAVVKITNVFFGPLRMS